MPTTSFLVMEPLMVLSNGGPASKVWPGFYRAAKGRKFTNTTVTIQGKAHDYLFVIFQSPTDVLLYNIDTDTVETRFKGMAAISELLSDDEWGFKSINFTGISAMQTGFKSFTIHHKCFDSDHDCRPYTRFTMWKCAGSGSGVADLDSCGHLKRDWYFWTCGISNYNNKADEELCKNYDYLAEEIRAGFTVPEYHHGSEFPPTAGIQFLVTARYSSILKMGTGEMFEPPGSFYSAGPKYYNYSNFFQVVICLVFLFETLS